MHGRNRRLAATLTVAAVAAVGVSALPASGAQSSDRAEELRRADTALAARSRAAVLELYALQAQVRHAHGQLTATRERLELLSREREAVAARLTIARRSVAAAHRGLARRIRALYEQGGTDPLAIILSAGSIEEALETFDGLGFAARQDRTLVARTRSARAQLERLQKQLAARAEVLEAAAREAEARAAALAAREAERRSFLASLSVERRLRAAEIASLQRTAAAADARSATLTPPSGSTGGGTTLVDAAPGPAAAAPVHLPAAAQTPVAQPAGARTLVVAATAYAIRGRTASGLPTSWGVAAVDPAVIPLGTRFFVPGYGEAVAADIGSGVRGNEIDLWFPSHAQALAWGRRTVSIVIH